MIGGTDLIFPTKAGTTALDFCLRMIHKEWPEAIYEDAITGKNLDDYHSTSLAERSELFVFRDMAVAREWDNRGADPSLENTMVHIILSDGYLTLVVDDPSEAIMKRILTAIQNGLHNDCFLVAPVPQVEGASSGLFPLQSRQASSPDSASQSAPK